MLDSECVDHCDSKGSDKRSCPDHRYHSKRCPWRSLLLSLVSILRCKTDLCLGPQDCLQESLHTELWKDSLGKAADVLREQYLDSDPKAGDASQVYSGCTKGCGVCVQNRGPPETLSEGGRKDICTVHRCCATGTPRRPEDSNCPCVSFQCCPEVLMERSPRSTGCSGSRPTTNAGKGSSSYGTCKNDGKQETVVMEEQEMSVIEGKTLGDDTKTCHFCKGETGGSKGCNSGGQSSVPHGDPSKDCRTDACKTQEFCTKGTPVKPKQSSCLRKSLQCENPASVKEYTPNGETVNSGSTHRNESKTSTNKTESRKSESKRESEVQEQYGRMLQSDPDDVEVEIRGTIKDGGDEIMWLVDTGATKSTISTKMYHQHLQHVPVEKANTRLTAINGSNIPVLGKCTLTIVLQGKEYKHTFLVAGVEDEGVLGKDFLSKHRCYWNWEQKTLEIDGNEIKCRVPLINDIPAVDIKAVRSYTVPPQSEIIIEGALVGVGKTMMTGMATGKTKFMKKRELGVAATLVKRHGHTVPVRVLNPSFRKKFVGIGDIVASYQAVEILDNVKPEICRSVKSTDSESLPLTQELEELYERCIEGLNPTEQEQLRKLLEDYSDVFAAEGKPLGRTNLVQHKIHTGDHCPIKQRPRRAPLGQEDVIQRELDSMLEQGVITPSNSPWASPVVLVKKKDGSVRFCIDYRRLNDITEKDAYPLPRVDDNLDALAGARLFSTLDLASGYWQVEMHPEDREKTAFCTRYGLYQWRVMPFGLCNAPSTFERLMERVLRGLQWKVALLYLDDVIVFSSTTEQQLERLKLVFDRIREANLQLKPKKCHLFQKEVSFLGHRVSAEGVATEEDKVKAVKEWPTPKSAKAIRSFLGLTGYYRKFVKDYADVAAPLIALTQKSAVFKWGQEEQEAFDELKTRLITSPILGYPSPHGKFILDTDASNCSIGAVLSQVQDGREVVIAYGSRRLSKSERNYCVTRQELLAIVWFTEHFKHYLIGRKFLLRTDHGSLRWLFGFKEPEGQMARWLERLAVFDFDIEHRAGSKHGNSDGMSRIPCEGNCRNCRRGQELAWNEQEKIKAVRTKKTKRRGRTQRQRKNKVTTGPDPSSWMKEIQRWQEEDPDLQVVGTWRERPKWVEIAREKPEVKYYWSRWDQLQQRDGIWYYKWEESKDFIWKVIVPPAGQAEILSEHHDSPIAGHFGMEKTLNRLRKSPYFWPKLRDSVEKWCRECHVCARTKHANRNIRAPMKSVGTGSTLERVGIDILGPLPETVEGNRFILVVGDYWTKWMEAYSLPDHTASTVASTLVHQFIARFGIPDQIHSDQGREFESNLFQEMCQLLRIDKTKTTPWRPCSNGLVENFNKTLGTMLRQLTSHHQRDWDQYVELATMAYRSTVHESTGQTPNKMMLGRELPMPSYLLLATPEQVEQKQAKHSGYDFVEELQNKILEAHALAREQLKKSHLHQKKQYDRKATMSEWSVGAPVWLFNPTKHVGKSPKLTTFWEETPYVITERVNDVVMKIQKSKTSKARIVHVDRLKLVEGQVDTSWFNKEECEQLVDGDRDVPCKERKKPHITVMEEMGLYREY